MQKIGNRKVKVTALMASLGAGGAERVTLNIINGLDPSKFKVVLVLIDKRKNEFSKILNDGIEVVHLEKLSSKHASLSIVKTLWQNRSDVLFVSLSHVNLLISLLKPFLPSNLKIVARETNLLSLNNLNYQNTWFWNYLYRKFYKRLDLIICQSEPMRQDLVSNFDISKDKTAVLLNPVDVERVACMSMEHQEVIPQSLRKPLEDEVNLVAVCGLRPEKNLVGLVRAIGLIKAPLVKVFIIGNGPEKKNIINETIKLNLTGQVFFCGFRENPFSVMKASDALILSSFNEGMPNVVLEALVLGLPIISTPAGGSINWLLSDREDFFLADSSEPSDIADAVLEFIKKRPIKMDKFDVYRFSTSKILDNYENIFIGEKL